MVDLVKLQSRRYSPDKRRIIYVFFPKRIFAFRDFLLQGVYMMKKTNNKRDHLRKLVVTATFCSLAFLMTFVFRFNVSFLTFDLKDTILAVVALMYGPLYAVASSLIVALIEFLSISDTGPYGFIMNFLASATFTFTCGLIYKYKRDFVGAIVSVVTAAVTLVCVMLTANLFITPYYMGVDRTAVTEMIPSLLLPFNLCKAFINASLTMMIYKPVTSVLKKSGIISSKTTDTYALSLKGVILIIICAIIAVLSIMFIILKMNGSLTVFK